LSYFQHICQQLTAIGVGVAYRACRVCAFRAA